MTLVEKLVRCYSPSGNEKDVVSLFLDELTNRGFQTHRDSVGNAIGTIGHGSTHIYLVGHIDTVPGEISVHVENGQLFGRGSVDAKGALSVFVEVATGFSDSQKVCITVIGCVQEETDSRGAHHILETHTSPDYVVIGEPSGWNAVTLGYRGCLTIDYILKKPRVHHGAPEQTPAEEAVIFYQSLCDSYPDRGDGFTNLTLKLTQFNTQSSGNYETVKMNIDVRIPKTFDIDGFKTSVAKLKQNASVSLSGLTPPVVAEKRNGLVRAFLGGIRKLGGKPCFKYKTGTSDMNLLNGWGCPIVTYGPGDSILDHTPNEHLDLEDYKKAIKVLQTAINTLELSKNES